jgi:hypothetical protein
MQQLNDEVREYHAPAEQWLPECEHCKVNAVSFEGTCYECGKTVFDAVEVEE